MQLVKVLPSKMAGLIRYRCTCSYCVDVGRSTSRQDGTGRVLLQRVQAFPQASLGEHPRLLQSERLFRKFVEWTEPDGSEYAPRHGVIVGGPAEC